MKTKDELNALKKEVEALNKKLAALTEEELKQITGGESSIIGRLDIGNNQIDQTKIRITCIEFATYGPCYSPDKGNRDECAICPKNEK